MDLHLMSAAATDQERDAVDEVLGSSQAGTDGDGYEGRVARGGHAAALDRRHLLLPALQSLQRSVGWISEGGLNYLCQRLPVPPAEAYGVASFYALLSTQPRPPMVMHVCDDIACRASSGPDLREDLEGSEGPPGEVVKSRMWLRSPCLGQCEQGTAAYVQWAGQNDFALAPAPGVMGWPDVPSGEDEANPDFRLESLSSPQTSHHEERQGLRLLQRIGVVDPRSLDDYRSHGGYEAVRRAFELGPEGVIGEVRESKLLGRGGAAFPTGVKWEAVAGQPVRPHFFVGKAAPPLPRASG